MVSPISNVGHKICMFNEKDGDNKKLEIKEKKLIVIKKIEENNLEQEK
jgi:hypothetical protein